MNDLDIETLRAGWRSNSNHVEPHLASIRRRRWVPMIALAVEVAASIVTAVLGAWLIWLGMRTHGAAYSTIGAPLFACGFSLAIVLADARRGSLAWRDETPADLLRTGLAQVEASLRVVEIMRWYASGILLFLLVRRAVDLVQGTPPTFAVWVATSGGATICAGYWLWLTARRQRFTTERSLIARLIAQDQTA